VETRLELLALVVLALASGWYGYRLTRRHRTWRNALLAAGGVLVAWPIAAYLWPDRLQILYPAFRYGDMLFATAFCWVGAVAAAYGDSARHRVLTAVLGIVLSYFVFAGPIYLALNADSIRALNFGVRQGVTVQEALYTCVPSALATVLRRWGYEYTEGELAYALRTSFQGTSPARVPPLVSRLPLQPPLEARVIDTTYEELKRHDVPVILIGMAGPVRHAVALIEIDSDRITIGDPLHGPITARQAELGKVFAWNGQAILIQPAGSAPALRPHLTRCQPAPPSCASSR